MANKQAVLGSGARFSGKISNAKSIEINGFVEADLSTEKVTIGSSGKFLGAVNSQLVVIAGEYEGKAKIGKVNVDNNPDISVKYGIRSIPALLIFKNGEVVDQIVGAVPKQHLTKQLDAQLG